MKTLFYTLLFFLLFSCESSIEHFYKIENDLENDLEIEKFKNGSSYEKLFIKSNDTHEETSGSFMGGDAPFFPELNDSIKMIFSDGKTLIFYNDTDVLDANGMVLETLPPRIDGVNGIQELPISGISNILSEDGWEVDCNKRRNQKCEYLFKITNAYYQLSK